MFMKTKKQGSFVKKGETVGYIFHPLRGEILDYVTAGKSGFLFTIREYPLVVEGSLLERILAKEDSAALKQTPMEDRRNCTGQIPAEEDIQK